MKFDDITGTITITFDMDAMEALARICRYAAENWEEQPLASAYLSAFTAATMVARNHGDMRGECQQSMEQVRTRLQPHTEEAVA